MHTCVDMRGDRNRLSVARVGSNQCETITSSRRAPRDSSSSSKMTLGEEKNHQKHSGIITGNNLRFFPRLHQLNVGEWGRLLPKSAWRRHYLMFQQGCEQS